LAKETGNGTRGVTLLIGALDALVSAAAILAILVAGSSLSWWLDAGATTDWFSAFRNAIDIWFALHGVAINFASSTFAGLEVPAFAIAVLPLGAALLIFALGWRSGKRLFGSLELWPAWIGSALVYGGVSGLLLSLSATKELSPDPIGSYFVPVIVFTGGVVCGSLFGALPHTAMKLTLASERVAGREFIEGIGEKVNWVVRSVASPALRAGTAFVFVLQLISSVVFAVLLGYNWLNVIQLYEQLQGGVIGGFSATLMQLAFLPNFTYYVSSWLVGPGFAIGTGSSVSPLGTALGPLPTVPVFGAIPAGDFTVGMLVLVVPLLVALGVTIAVKKYAAEARHNFATPLASSIAMGLSIGFVAALEMALLALLTHAAIGPGRMQNIGADPLWVFVWVFLEVGVIAFLASFYAAKPNAASPIPEHLKR
jgi:Family of unknown function (DUF6350)